MGVYAKNKVDLSVINSQGKNAPHELIELSENAFNDQIKYIADTIIKTPTIKLILLAGPSSAGKTTSARLVKEELIRRGKSAEVISMDNFFLNRDVTPKLADGTYDYENVTSVDVAYFKTFVEEILSKGQAKMPIYDFFTGMRLKDYVDLVLPNNGILLIEGIHALNPTIIDNHQSEIFRIFVNPNTEYYYNDKLILDVRELRRIRRIIRDFYTRGIKPSYTLMNWKNVVDGEKKYIFPYKDNANYILDTTHFYEPLMYKKYIPALLDDSQESKSIEEDLSYFEELDASLVPETSLLNEFLVGVIHR